MKHITYAEKSLLVGDEAADSMMTYAAALAANQSADAVELHCISSDGDEVIATFLLDAGAPLMIETTHSGLPEPDNSAAIDYMQSRTVDLLPARPVASAELPSRDFDELLL